MQGFPVADQRILRGGTATLSYQFADADGEPAAPAGTVTIGITRADGSVLVAAGTATAGAGSSPRTFALTAANNLLLDMLTVTWTDGGDSSTHVELVEVVGGYYFTVAQARNAEASLRDTNKYPTADIEAKRREVEDEAEDICGVAFVPRYRHVTLDGPGCSELYLPDPMPRTIRSLSILGSALGAGALALLVVNRWGVISYPNGIFPAGEKSIVVGYEHGYDRPPSGLRAAALTRLRSRLNMAKSDIPDRAERFLSTDGATFTLSMPAKDRTGIPDVDAVYHRYRWKQVAQA